jgi:hypothetical protein
VPQSPTLNAAYIDVRSGIFEKGHTLARYALDGLTSKIMAANCKTVLPDTEILQKELEKTGLLIEASSRVGKKMNKDMK